MDDDTLNPTPTPEDEAVLELARTMLDAARQGDAATLLSLVDQGAPVNLRDGAGNSALMLAAYHGHAELVAELAARGADVDLLNDRGQSPLAGAAFKGDAAVARALLAAGADPSLGTPDARETARYFERAEIVALLDEAGGPDAA
ncbi:ankyrin repeat domain-containing protein [Brachybacterium sp. J153]|uniref:ankyrin repeat domain-containing protein n=1 Tax=Brachybacterium sp. J153 TaxID=3116488 RepID=UPI002E7743CE|nr:ankyrin repeat domain-containing protein [Brachybacterium sp. J153]MEE1619228.1 ankyrin repeat domain-containing protein [Brachybacterium sp. J153]